MIKIIVVLLCVVGYNFSQLPCSKPLDLNDETSVLTPHFNGNIRTITEFTCDDVDTVGDKRDAECKRKRVFIDENSSIHEYAEYKGNRINKRILFKYDKLGLLINKTDYDRDGKEGDREVIHRDSSGHVLLVEYCNEGKLDSKIEYGYDKNGHLSFEKHYKTGGILDYEVKDYKYDEIGNCIRFTKRNNGDSPEVIIREFKYYGDK